MPAAASDAIAAAELPGLFEDLQGPFALAVSGGADSMALLYLFAEWWRSTVVDQSASATIPDPIVLTVDHGLRAESAAEAAFVANAAKKFGFAHQTLTWDGPRPATGLQAAARAARYALLTGVCRNSTPLRSLVVAHHLDDQAETFLMRLARGSGVDGLAAMRPQTMMNGVPVLRPLLRVPKSRLLATLNAHGISWCDDASNSDRAFERVRWRSVMPTLESNGLTAAALARTAARMRRAASALECVTDELSAACHADHHNGAYTSLDYDVFAAAHTEMRIRLMQRLLGAHGGTTPSAQLSEIEDLSDRMVSPRARPGSGAATLSGAMVRWSPRRNQISIYREPARAAEARLSLEPGQSAVWDGRFEVSLAADAESSQMCQSGPLRVRALTAADYATLTAMNAAADATIPAQATLTTEIATTLPTFYAGDRLIAVPFFTGQSQHSSASLPRHGHGLCSAVWLKRGV